MAFLNGSSSLAYNISDLFLDTDPPNVTIMVPTSTTIPQEVALSLRHTRFAVQTVLTPVVVLIGLLGNILNILVLLQPSMRSSTNVYILVLSLADSIYLVFNFALSILDCRKRGLSDSAYYFNPYGRFVSNFSGNVAVWVTVGFTVERFIAVCHPMHGKRWCTVSRAKLASLSIVILTLINTLPTIFELEVIGTDQGLRCQYTDFANQFGYEMVYSWWYVTVFTFIPLICLAIFNIVLIRALLQASRKRQELVQISGGNSKRTSQHVKKNISSANNGIDTHQSNKYGTVRNGFTQRAELSVSDNEYTPASNSCLSPIIACQQPPKGQQHHQLQHKNQQYGVLQNANSNNKQNNQRNSLGNRSNRSNTGKDGSPKYGDANSNVSKRQGKRMSREQNKVTSLLVTIVMIFFLCQLPWTALFLYKTYLSNNNLTGNGNHIKIAGNVCNLLGLINASGNFYLYSCFSKRFRKTFKSLVLFWRRKSNIFTSIV